jgi:hypothetical protein
VNYTIIRDKATELFGCPDWLSFRIEDKMARTLKTAVDILNNFRVQLAPSKVRESTQGDQIRRSSEPRIRD